MKRLCSIILLCLSMTACYRSNPIAMMSSPMGTRVVTQLPRYSAIDIHGPFAVKINDGVHHAQVSLQGPRQLINYTTVSVTNHTLHVKAPWYAKWPANYPLPMKLTITLPRLNNLSINGQAQVDLHKRRRQALNVTDNSTRRLNIDGYVNLHNLVSHSPANINIKNVNSRNTNINILANGNVTISGKRIDAHRIEHIGNGNLSINHVSNRNPLLVKIASDGNTTIKGRYIDLHQFINQGRGNVNISRIKTNYLNVYNASNGNTKLQGSIVLQKLVQRGNGRLAIVGLNSDNLNINALHGHGQLFLYGHMDLLNLVAGDSENIHLDRVTSDELMLSLTGHAQVHLIGSARILNAQTARSSIFDGYYFPVKRIYIKTLNASQANLRPQDALIAYAKNTSDVYYYQQPKLIAPYMSNAGSILPMFHKAPPYPINWRHAEEYSK